MENNISKIHNCAGCFSCGDICPKGAISYIKKSDGFLYPKIDKNKCVNCGKCIRICPQLNQKLNNDYKQKGYISYSKDKNNYFNSASGGIFSELATYFLNNNGLVYGVAFDDNLKVKHTKIERISELEKIQRSKYVQSNATGIYNDCKKELDNGKMILFSGTPCQISALKNYLNKDYKNLLTCDIVCHGVPSQDMFDKCIELENKKENGKIIKFDFRYKCKKNTSPRNFRYILEKNGKQKEKIGNHYEFPFLVGFYKYLILRNSCYSCKYANMKRVGDLTLGDYWEAKDKFGKDKGISMIVVNTQKGQTFLNRINKNLFLKEEDIKLIKNGNETFNRPTKKPNNRKEYLNMYNVPFQY